MGITNHHTRYVRPAVWGFFICIAITVILFVVRLFIPSFINYHWDEERMSQRKRAEQVIREAFQSRIDQLAKIAEHASKDTLLNTNVNLNDRSAALRAFQYLNSYKLNDDQTIDLIDTNGNVLAWNGPSISSLYKKVFDRNSFEPFAYVTQNGLRTYLTVGKRLAHDNLSLLVSEPLEVNSPISNRFIQKVSFCAELLQSLKTQVILKLPQTYISHRGEFNVPVFNQANKIIAEFFVTEITLDGTTSTDYRFVYDVDSRFLSVRLFIFCRSQAFCGLRINTIIG